jgi:hypothetical protein
MGQRGPSGHRVTAFPRVALLGNSQVHEYLGAADTGDRSNRLVDQTKEVLIVLAHHFDQQVELPGAYHDVLGFDHPHELLGDPLDVASTLIPSMA